MTHPDYYDWDYDGDRLEDFYGCDEDDPVRHGDYYEPEEDGEEDEYYEPQAAFLDLGRL